MAYRQKHDSKSDSPDFIGSDLFTFQFWDEMFGANVSDNFGVFKDDLEVLRTQAFPKHLHLVTPEQIAVALDWYEAKGMIRRGTCRGRNYGEIVNFDKHQPQTVRNRGKKGKYPRSSEWDLVDTAGTSAGHPQDITDPSPTEQQNNRTTEQQNNPLPPEGAEGRTASKPSGRDVLLAPFQQAFPGMTPWGGSRKFFDEWRSVADDAVIVQVLGAAKGVAKAPGWVNTILAAVVEAGSFEAWDAARQPRAGPPPPKLSLAELAAKHRVPDEDRIPLMPTHKEQSIATQGRTDSGPRGSPTAASHRG